jgi:hypothetical protein
MNTYQADFDAKLALYRARVPDWSDAKFNAAAEQAGDEQQGNEEDFWVALADFLDGSMPLSYYNAS